MKKEQKVTLSLLIIYLVILTWIILLKLQFSVLELNHSRNINVIPFAGSVIVNGRLDYTEIINNLIVFIPVGVYLEMLIPGWSFFKKTGSIAGLSLAYEVIQFVFAIGASDITDVISNTAGGIMGILICILFTRLFKERVNRILNVIATIGTVLVVGFIGLLLISNS